MNIHLIMKAIFILLVLKGIMYIAKTYLYTLYVAVIHASLCETLYICDIGMELIFVCVHVIMIMLIHVCTQL